MEDDDGVIAALTEGRRGVVASRAGLIATETGNVVGGQVESTWARRRWRR